MKTGKNAAQIFLVLVPHGDTRQILRKYSEDLLISGLKSVYAFPLAVPLAALKRPLSAEELKHCAGKLRETVSLEKEGKFTAAKAGIIPFSIGGKNLFLFGPKLNAVFNYPDPFLSNRQADGHFVQIQTFTDESSDARVFSNWSVEKNILGCFLINEKNKNPPKPPNISFRAGAVANMYIKQVKNGFKWKIGKLYWLPKTNKAAEDRQGCQGQTRNLFT